MYAVLVAFAVCTVAANAALILVDDVGTARRTASPVRWRERSSACSRRSCIGCALQLRGGALAAGRRVELDLVFYLTALIVKTLLVAPVATVAAQSADVDYFQGGSVTRWPIRFCTSRTPTTSKCRRSSGPRTTRASTNCRRPRLLEAGSRTSHHATIADVNHELSGKIVIPQPFGKLKSFYAAETGFCISKFMVIELIIAALIVLIFTRLAPKVATGKAPKGYFWNLFEASLLFIRDGIARPAIDSHDEHDHSHHDAARSRARRSRRRPHSRQGASSTTATSSCRSCGRCSSSCCSAICSACSLGSAHRPVRSASRWRLAGVHVRHDARSQASFKFGPVGFWKNQVPSMDLPLRAGDLPEADDLRDRSRGPAASSTASWPFVLLANMVAGHLVLLSVLGLIVACGRSGRNVFGTYGIVTGDQRARLDRCLAAWNCSSPSCRRTCLRFCRRCLSARRCITTNVLRACGRRLGITLVLFAPSRRRCYREQVRPIRCWSASSCCSPPLRRWPKLRPLRPTASSRPRLR